MARNISAAALEKLTAQYGSEPINIIEIGWSGTARDSYADRDIEGGIKGKVLELGGLDEVLQVSGGSQSQQISVTLDDVDGSIKAIMDTVDIHKRPCWIYQWFDGIPTDDKFLIFKGLISSPINWNERDRTVTFDVISKIEDAEVGFSIEEGDFVSPPEELIGKPWPLCFGTVINVPALRTRPPYSGILETGVGIRDFTLQSRIDQAGYIVCPHTFRGFACAGSAGSTQINCNAEFRPDENCEASKDDTIADLEFELEQQIDYEFPTITVFDGDRFPQNTPITLDINGGKFTGTFSGNVFTITSRKHPEFDELGGVPEVTPFQGGPIFLTLPMEDTQLGEVAEASQAAFSNMPTANFFWANPGSTVVLDGDEEIIYIANILPSTILRVAAYRVFETGARLLVTVPPEFYSVRQVDYTGYQVMEIVLSRPLSRRAAGWEDELYVTMTSSVGPNTVDVLEWFIETYSDFSIDENSFNHVRALIENYPSHFWLQNRMNLLTVLQEIAEQARCALWLKDDTFYISYLSEEPTPVDTITVSDIAADPGLSVFHTDTEDLVTKYVGEWREDYSKEKPQKIILRHNVSKYGTQEESRNFYIYNIYSLVLKSATFWLIRKANTWRKVSFSTALHKLNLEVFDAVTLDLPDVAPDPVIGIVEKATYNSATQSIDFEVWTPIKSGTQVAYDFAFPAAIEETKLFPTEEERTGGFGGSGSGPSFETRPPSDHQFSVSMVSSGLFSGFSQACNGDVIPINENLTGRGSVCRPDHGNRNPSDIGDEKPEPKASDDTSGFTGNQPDPQFRGGDTDCCAQVRAIANEALAAARRAQQDASEAAAASNAKGDGSVEDLPSCEASPCTSIVRVFKAQVVQVGTPDGFKTEAGACGTPVPGPGGSNTREDYCFNSAQMATAFLNAIQEQAASQTYCVGSTVIVNANSSIQGGSCDEPEEGEARTTGFSRTPI